MNGCNPTPDKFDINGPPAPGPAFRSGPLLRPFSPSLSDSPPSISPFASSSFPSNSSRPRPPFSVLLAHRAERRGSKEERRSSRIDREREKGAEVLQDDPSCRLYSTLRAGRQRRAGSLFYSRDGREHCVWLKFHRWPFSLFSPTRATAPRKRSNSTATITTAGTSTGPSEK